MLTRDQINTIAISRIKRAQLNFFSHLPEEILLQIIRYTPNTHSPIAIALQHAANAQKENLLALIAMLEANPRLLLEAGNVITPGGHDIRRVTIYEFCLGAGDPELAEKVGTYFDKIPKGETERLRQYRRYQGHIEGMPTQPYDDLMPLIELVKQSPLADVRALLTKDMNHASPLRDALIEFRNAHAPRIMTHSCMHYNYNNLRHTFEILDREWDNLYKVDGGKYEKIYLVWRQLFGFELRRLPGVDRCAFAHGLYHVVNNHHNEPLNRSYHIKKINSEFPVTLSDSDLNSLGIDYAINVFAATGVGRGLCLKIFETYLSHKTNHLLNLKLNRDFSRNMRM